MISHSLNIMFKWIKDTVQLIRFSHEAAEAICAGKANAVSLVFGLAKGVFVFHPAGTVIHRNPQGFGQD